jgi:hypothetical protein
MHGLQEIIYANANARSRAKAAILKLHIQDAHRRIAVIRSWASDYPRTTEPAVRIRTAQPTTK